MYPIMTGKHYPTMGGKNNPAIDSYVRSIATNSGLSWGGKHGIQYVK